MSRIVITGANRGIGLELARQFVERGDEVIALVRSASSALLEMNVEIIDGLDLSSDDLSPASTGLGDRTIDVLLNNAGVLERTGLDELNLPAMRRQFEVNALGPLKVTNALSSHLVAGSKVAHVTSRMGSLEDNTSGSHYGYRMSKAALNMAAKSMSVDLAGREISVCVLHPGYVRTDMTGHNGLIDAQESARGLIARIDELSLDTSGGFWHQNGERLPW
jgi:NAD(P)-dependent dehydrogenase (short-subunit alcohol dehydrogenase family)